MNCIGMAKVFSLQGRNQDTPNPNPNNPGKYEESNRHNSKIELTGEM